MSDSSVILSWEDPPETSEDTNKIGTVVRELKANPDRWAKIYSGPWTFFPWWASLTEMWEIEMRTVKTDSKELGARDIYARFTSGASDATKPPRTY